MVTVCPSQFAIRRTLFHVLVGCGLLMLKVSRLKLPVIWLLVSMLLNPLTNSQSLTRLPKPQCRSSRTRNSCTKMLTMRHLSPDYLIQLTKLGYDATPFNQRLKQNAKREMRLRLGKATVADVLAAQPVTTNLLKFMRA